MSDTSTVFHLIGGRVDAGMSSNSWAGDEDWVSGYFSHLQLCSPILRLASGWLWGDHSRYPVNSVCSTCLTCFHPHSPVAVVSFWHFPFYSESSVMCTQSTVRPTDRKGSGGYYICRLETSKEALEKSDLNINTCFWELSALSVIGIFVLEAAQLCLCRGKEEYLRAL